MNLFQRVGVAASLTLSLLGAGSQASADMFLPDLVVSAVEHKLSSNGQEVLRYTIKNQGLGYAGAFKVRTTGTGGTNTKEVRTLNGLAAGTSVSYDHWTGFTTSCDFVRTIQVDSGMAITESVEGNNSKTVADVMCPRPELQVKTETFNSATGISEFQRITITNKGTASAGSFQLAVTSRGGLNTNMSKTISSLPVDASVSFNFYPKAECDYSMTATVDSGKVINEFNETNNVATATDHCIK